MFTAVSPGPIKVRFFPDYRDYNPYQHLLYRSLGPNVDATPMSDFAELTANAKEQAPADILHLHWETAAVFAGGLSPERFLDVLSGFRDRGGRIVWTMHNLMPHSSREQAVALQVREGLLALADIVHLHSLPALAAAMEHHALPLANVRIIPHGNYDGVYPIIPHSKARAALQLETARTVAVLPGQIRSYKAPNSLVEAFVQVAGPDDRLLLVGHQDSDFKELTIPDDARVIAMFGFATASDLAQAIAAADFVVLPYTASLTSGSAILAQTLGRGILGSDTAGLRDVVQVPSTGILFDPETSGGLTQALQNALSESSGTWANRGKAAALAARARDWVALGATWLSLFNELANIPRPARVLT